MDKVLINKYSKDDILSLMEKKLVFTVHAVNQMRLESHIRICGNVRRQVGGYNYVERSKMKYKMKCQKCGSEMIEKEDYVYVIPDINLAVANLKAYVCPECDYVELPSESVDAIEKAEEEWRRQLKEKEKTKAEI